MTQLDEKTDSSVRERAQPPTASHRPALPAAAFEIDPEIDERIDRTIEQYGLSEKTARELLRDWCERGPFAKKDIDFDAVPLRVVSSAVLHVEQIVQLERRSLTSTTEAYHGQADFKEGDLEDVWETQRFGKFKKGSMRWKRRGSGEVIRCYECEGSGKRPCKRCVAHGKLQAKCRSCRGTGTGRDRERCPKCEGKGEVTVPCRSCRGKGFNQCSTCGGSGRLRSSQTIKATATVHKRSVVIGAPPTIDKAWIKAAAAEATEWFEGDRDVLADYVGRALPKDTQARVAQYGIRTVPLSWTTFFVGKEFKVYFVGTHHELKRVASLLDKKRIVLNVAMLIPILGALALATRFLLFR